MTMSAQSRIKALLSYNPDTGEFRWLQTWGRAKSGSIAGWLSSTGHRYIKVAGLETTAARLAWLYVYGSLPSTELEHINSNSDDCRITNLRVQISRIGLELTATRLRSIVDYSAETGLFQWRDTSCKKMRCKPAGCTKENGYVLISADNNIYRAHRLAWLYVHGRWPRKHLDHINGNPSDNRLSNLREATIPENMSNSKRPATNTSGYKGVSWHAGGNKWQAHIRYAGRSVYLGLFPGAKKAHEAYCAAARKLKKEFARTA